MEEKIIDIKGFGSPGVSFTENFNKKLEKYAMFINKHKDEELEYKELQTKMNEELKITESAIRVDIPFLYNNGFLNDYRKDKIGKIKLSNFISNLGKAYIELIEIKEKYSGSISSDIYKKIEEILKLIIVLSLINRKNNGQEENYFEILRFIYENNSIDEKEFYLLKTINDKEELKREVEMYRKGKLNIILENNNTVFTYNKSMLIQAGLIKEIDKRYYIDENSMDLVEKII